MIPRATERRPCAAAAAVLLAVLLSAVRPASAGELVRNGGFDAGAAEWVVSPDAPPGWDPVSDGAASLQPHENFLGTVIHQNLNVVDVASKEFSVSIALTAVSGGAGRTVAVHATYLTAGGSAVRLPVLSPDNGTVGLGTVFTETFVLPADARKLVKIEIAREDYGEFVVDDVSLSAAGVVGGEVPRIDAVSPTRGPYGTRLTVLGSGFGTASGAVAVGGRTDGVVPVFWSPTVVSAVVGEPARGGRVCVTADGTESDIPFFFTPTDPGFTLDCRPASLRAVRGTEAEVVVSLRLTNGFAPAGGVSLALESDPAIPPASWRILPSPLDRAGGAAVAIDTAGLAPGVYDCRVRGTAAGAAARRAPFTLVVEAVSRVGFYEYDDLYEKVRLDAKTVTRQGLVRIYYELLNSEGSVLADSRLGTVSSNAPGTLAAYRNNWGWYDIYAVSSGTAALTVAAPDGTAGNLPVTVALAAEPLVEAVSLSPGTITNAGAGGLAFAARGTEAIGYATYGNIVFAEDTRDWTDETCTSVAGNLAVDHSMTDLGTYLLSAFIGDAAAPDAERVVPLTILNDPSFGGMRGGTRLLDPVLPAWTTEYVTVEFCDAGGGKLFSRDIFSYTGDGTFEIGGIPPGAYLLRASSMFEPAAAPQWYPNADGSEDAEPVVFAAGETTAVFFFLHGSGGADEGSVSGTVAWEGMPGSITVGLFAARDFSAAPVRSATLDAPGSFSFDGVAPGSYHLGAFLDAAGDGFSPTDDPSGWSGEGPVTVLPGIATAADVALFAPVAVTGDANMDGATDIADVVLCFAMAAGVLPPVSDLADMDGDGTVDVADVLLLLARVTGLPDA